ncbi:MAG TPA: RNA polymerase sigma factor [Vicinamibacterales bacterium]|jgi:RNA polymerase sigma-70 factor (ECF subfamily)
MSDERADVALTCEGDERAFERLYRRHVSRIHGLVRRMAGSEAVDELTQDVFVRAWEKIHTFRGESQFGTWLHRLAVNLVLEYQRVHARRQRHEADDEQAVDGAVAAPQIAGFGIDFEAAVERLPEGARQVFMLHDVEGYKHREVAALVGITSGTSKGQLHRARMILRQHLGAGPAPGTRSLEPRKP